MFDKMTTNNNIDIVMYYNKSNSGQLTNKSLKADILLGTCILLLNI